MGNASPPLTFLEKKWASGAGNNNLIAAATQNTERKTIPQLDYDVHRNVSNFGRRTLMSIGRWVYSNFDAVRGALHEQAEYAGATFIPQYRGKDPAFKDAAENQLYIHHRICDLAGPPYNMRTFRRNLILGVKRDGDIGLLLTHSPGGYPMFQVIPGHRIGSQQGQTLVQGGRWDGARIIDGVIVNDFGAPIAYRILKGDNPFDYSLFQDVPASSMRLFFVPEYVGQVRGFSALGASLFNWQDVAEYRRFELIAQKVGSAIALIEKNEEAEPPPGTDAIVLPESTEDTSETATGLVNEVLDGGLIRYLKAKSGAELEAFRNDRPSGNQQDFEANIVRSCFYGMDWSVDFSLNPTRIGAGAPMRMVVEKINRTDAANQDLLLEPACRYYDMYALSIFGQPRDKQGPNGKPGLAMLKLPPDWDNWEYQPGAKFTADAKYDSDVAANQVRSGFTTRRRIAGCLGEELKDVRDGREFEADDLFTRARRLADKHKITFELALSKLESDTPNGNMPPAEPEREEPAPKEKQ